MTAIQETGKLERLPCEVFTNAPAASRYVAVQIAELIRSRAAKQKNCVLGLATGSTPVGIYAELVRMHREEGLSFRTSSRSTLTNTIRWGRTNCRATSAS